jgi:nicotinamidase-related amidase
MTLSSSTLVIVDLQPIFQDSASPWSTPGFDSLLGGVVSLAKTFDSVVSTRFTLPARAEGSWVEYYQRWPEVVGPNFEGHFGLVREIAQLGSYVIARPTFSKWCEELADRVQGSMTVVGVATECCVLATALAAVDAGCSVTVVRDLCRGSTVELHRSALTTLEAFAPQLRVVESAELIEESDV